MKQLQEVIIYSFTCSYLFYKKSLWVGVCVQDSTEVSVGVCVAQSINCFLHSQIASVEEIFFLKGDLHKTSLNKTSK